MAWHDCCSLVSSLNKHKLRPEVWYICRLECELICAHEVCVKVSDLWRREVSVTGGNMILAGACQKIPFPTSFVNLASARVFITVMKRQSHDLCPSPIRSSRLKDVSQCLSGSLYPDVSAWTGYHWSILRSWIILGAIFSPRRGVFNILLDANDYKHSHEWRSTEDGQSFMDAIQETLATLSIHARIDRLLLPSLKQAIDLSFN